MFLNIKWITNKANKLCSQLRNQILNSYYLNKWIPYFLYKPILYIKHNFLEHKVIIELTENQERLILNRSETEKDFNCKIKHILPLINGFSTSINVRKIEKIINHPKVKRIWLDQKIQICLDIATPSTNAPKVWSYGKEGKGIGIAIIDTGVYPHPDLTTPQNRIIAFKDFVKGRKVPYDDNGHGTHCAGDAAGNGCKSNGKYKGPAPMANIISVKVFDKTGSSYISNVIAGIQWSVEFKEKYSINVISMSLGANAAHSSKEDLLCQAVRKAWDSGIVVCVSAGNEGPGMRTINTPGIEPKVITVGALDDKKTINIDDDMVAPFSSRGPTIDGQNKPDLLTPGVNIVSLRSPNSFHDNIYPYSKVGNWYTTLTGTSIATPICAGVVALILESSPGISPDFVKKVLLETCEKVLEEPGEIVKTNPNNQGAGVINAEAAINKALNLEATK